MNKKLLALVVATAAVTVLAFGATTASAHFWAADTNIDVNAVAINGSIRVEGDLESSRARCERFRFVSLWAFESGSNQPTLVDGDVSDFSGEFVLQGGYPQGTDFFRVHVTRQNVGQDGHRHICRGDTAEIE